MPWSTPKPIGAYLALYKVALDEIIAGSQYETADWKTLSVYDTSLPAKRGVVEGRVWAKEFPKEREDYRWFFKHWKLCFRMHLQPNGYALQMRALPIDDKHKLGQALFAALQKE